MFVWVHACAEAFGLIFLKRFAYVCKVSERAHVCTQA